jgi:tetratricopeptide (TPR) repeat protein
MKLASFRAAALIATAVCQLGAQTAPAKWADTISHEIDRAYIAGDLEKMQSARALAERVATAFPKDGLILHYEAFALYREGTLQMGRGGDGIPLFTRAEQILNESLKLHPLAESHALLSSIYGFLIAKDPSRGMELGMASGVETSTALAEGPHNPRVWMIRALGAMYTPPEYGGGLKSAEEFMKRSIELYEKDAPKPGQPSWGKAEAHVWLGQIYQQMKDPVRAAAEFRTALSIEPDFAWAKSLAASAK